jgi:uncharacterized protein (DUF362 family)
MSGVVYVLRRPSADEAHAALLESWAHLRDDRSAVLFKPNLLHHRHALGGEHAAVVTQAPALEFAWRAVDALGLRGPRLVADAPQGDADFGQLLDRTGLERWQRERGVTVIDLRNERWEERNGVPTTHHSLPGDPAGAARVDLSRLSAFHGQAGSQFYGADYNIAETNAHHHGDTHEYLFSGSALRSGVIVNLPKLKTHKKVGVTLSLKNLVGLNADKNWLPHHRLGTPSQGGDAYPDSRLGRRVEARLIGIFKRLAGHSPLLSAAAGHLKPAASSLLGDTMDVVRSGNWWGNDTVWRMVLDLNRILLYARPDGSLADTVQRRTVSMIDGLVAGEAKGPEAPDAVDAGVLVAGDDFVAVDIVATTLMGFDYRKVPHLVGALDPHPLPLSSIRVDELTVRSNVPEWDRNLWEIDPASMFRFRPHFGWTGYLERQPAPVARAARA